MIRTFFILKGLVLIAVTNIRPIHISSGATSKSSIQKNIDYIIDGAKTNNGKFISCYKCDHETAAEQFDMSKKIYFNKTGRTQKNNIVAYSVIQSFDGFETSPEEANEIGYKLAEKITGGQHSFIVSTHVNTGNVHNHITWNSTNLDCNAKWKDVKRSGKDVARLSDNLCKEYNLSVIENKKEENIFKHYGEWGDVNGQRKIPFKKQLQQAIEEVLLEKPKTFDEFLLLMYQKGFEVKRKRQIIHTSIYIKIAYKNQLIFVRYF